MTEQLPRVAGSNELKQHWAVILACLVGVGAGTTGLPFYTLGMFIGPLQEQFGWSRAATQGMFTLFTFVGLACVPAVGYLVDRFGVRPVGLLSLAGAAIGFLLLALMTSSLMTFYFAGGCLAVLAAGTSPISWTRAITGWFDRQRGIALGLALAGTGLAGWLAPAYVSVLLNDFGWRAAYAGLAALPAIALVVVYFLLREPPAVPVVAATTQTATPGASEVATQLDLSVSQAVRHYRFWVIALGFFMVSIGIGGSIPNLVPLMVDAGMTRGEAAAHVGWLGVSVILGRLVAGYLIDRFWAPGVAAIMLSIPAVSALLLSQTILDPLLLPISIGLIGLAAGAEFDLIAYLASRYFGTAHYAKIYGLLYAIFMLGAGIAPPVFGYCFDVFGSYQPILQVAAGLFIAGALVLLTLGPYPRLAGAR